MILRCFLKCLTQGGKDRIDIKAFAFHYLSLFDSQHHLKLPEKHHICFQKRSMSNFWYDSNTHPSPSFIRSHQIYLKISPTVSTHQTSCQ